MITETDIELLKEKIDSINREAWETRVNDSPRSLSRSRESLELAKTINYRKGIADGLRNIGFCNIRLARNDEAVPLLNEAFSIYEAIHDLSGQALVHEYLGIVHRNKGDFGGSLELLFKALALTENTPVDENHATHYYQLGVTYKHLGDFETALEYFYRAMTVCRTINNSLYEGYCINLIGSIYFENGDYLKALDYFLQGLPMRRAGGDKWGEAGSLDNIGITYLKLNDLDKAIDYCKQSLAISQGTSDKKGEANALLHLAEIYEQAGDIKRASKFSNESLEIRKARGDKRGEAEVLLFLADLYKKRGNIEDQQIFDWISGAAKIAEEIKARDLLSKAYYHLHEYYGQKGNYKESLAQLDAHLQIEKELHKNAISQKVSNLEISHKAEAISQRNKELTELNEQIEKANAELRIESSLERVRTAAMAMNKPDDMLEVCKIISHELASLEVKEIRNVQTAIFYEGKGAYMNYEYYAKHDKQLITQVLYNNHPVAERFANQMLKGANEVFMHGFKGQEVRDWLNYQKTTNVFIDTFLESAGSLNYYWYSLGPVALGISSYVPLNEEEIELFKRFRNVFELAYRRYLDIEKAMAQAREAQIEAALERIRARATAMRSSDELIEVANILREQMGLLGQSELETCVVNLYDVETGLIHNWNAFRQPGLTSGAIITSASSFSGNASELTREMVSMYQSGKKEFTLTASGTKLAEFFDLLVTSDPQVANYTGRYIPEKVFYHFTAFTGGTLLTVSYQPPNEDIKLLQRRAASVFDMAYRRYLDLKKAEAQAREAEIEVSLERVRSRSIAMHKSDELLEVVASVFQQMQLLGFSLNLCNIVLFNNKTLGADYWVSGSKQAVLPEGYHVPYADHPFYHYQLNTWKNKEPFAVFELSGEVKKSWDEILFTKTDLKRLPDSTKKMMQQLDKVIISSVATKHGLVQAIGTEQLSGDDVSIVSRFAKVFEQTYTRFLDLQKAEAQAREAQIEASLEKVRAKVMAMKSSGDLNETSLVFGEQLRKLGIDWQFSYFWLIEEDKDDNTFWITWPDKKTSTTTYSLAEAAESFRECIVAWREQTRIHATHVPVQDVRVWLDTFERITNDAGGIALDIMTTDNFKEGVYYYDAMIKFGSFGIVTNRATDDEEKNIQSRFAIEFERAYTRFLDLQKAEAQTREALIEGALERVRARALAMQQPEELKDVAQVLRNEMGALGVEELETSSIYIHGESSENVECWYALQDPKHTEKKMVSDHFVLNLNDTWVGKEMKRFYGSDEKQISIVMQGANRKEWIEYCYKHSPAFSGFYGQTIPDRTYHLYKFSHGYIGAAAPGDISNESWKLLSRAASVFSLAYSRFKDLTQARIDLIKLKEEKKRAEDALTELQNTQKQLIQTEKMASLGELTAGIAHEIQNPLNFVNNFSDVSNELIEEMKEELRSGNTDGAIQIANDVKDNLEKILHHGKRADVIVKGMLQHSRSSSGVKEPTDINNLADEYLRLAYHGFRAKDKSFNAKFETNFDSNVDKVNVVPQDIGRVILNLINNAFYTVNEKKKRFDNGYDPIVTVSTKKIKDKIEISVKDNGSGIPQKVLDKIFQPFFTTKPTGQGTGLGLSLSYDIITKGHDGEINVKTNEENGSEFIILLPVN